MDPNKHYYFPQGIEAPPSQNYRPPQQTTTAEDLGRTWELNANPHGNVPSPEIQYQPGAATNMADVPQAPHSYQGIPFQSHQGYYGGPPQHSQGYHGYHGNPHQPPQSYHGKQNNDENPTQPQQAFAGANPQFGQSRMFLMADSGIQAYASRPWELPRQSANFVVNTTTANPYAYSQHSNESVTNNSDIDTYNGNQPHCNEFVANTAGGNPYVPPPQPVHSKGKAINTNFNGEPTYLNRFPNNASPSNSYGNQAKSNASAGNLSHMNSQGNPKQQNGFIPNNVTSSSYGNQPQLKLFGNGFVENTARMSAYENQTRLYGYRTYDNSVDHNGTPTRSTGPVAGSENLGRHNEPPQPSCFVEKYTENVDNTVVRQQRSEAAVGPPLPAPPVPRYHFEGVSLPISRSSQHLNAVTYDLANPQFGPASGSSHYIHSPTPTGLPSQLMNPEHSKSGRVTDPQYYNQKYHEKIVRQNKMNRIYMDTGGFVPGSEEAEDWLSKANAWRDSDFFS